MAIPWIKIETSLPHKPEVMRMAARLGISEYAVVGHLVAFWGWCDANLTGQCPKFFGTVSGLDRISGCDGFADAMVEAGWLACSDGQYGIPHFDRHLDQSAKTRAFDAERKRKQRGKRDNVPDSVGHCPKKTVTRGEEIRGDIEKTHAPGESQNAQTPERCPHEQGQQQVTIPEKMRTPECVRAFDDWCEYLDAAGLDTVNPRYNYQQAQAVWRQANRIGPDKWPACVEFSIANGYKSIIQKTEPPGATGSNRKSHPETDGDFIRAVQVCREFPSGSDYDRQKREEILGERIMKIVRQVKSSRLADVNEFNHRAMAEEWRLTKEGMK